MDRIDKTYPHHKKMVLIGHSVGGLVSRLMVTDANLTFWNADHSIIGDRGRGDTPNSSDGVVPYWSSHLEGAESERIVPSDHGSHQNKEGMEEADRILRLNLSGRNQTAG